ncbi:hypothetical protein [Sphaerotilus mobilis]|uniref:Transposase n=1 Tax=Sphaerotilus mobilis TaxID=47994 RepID=A0A4Q7LTE7_9BURK|nr:hypothetical protein EV685_0238 [Sphaerotilus mobilis]
MRKSKFSPRCVSPVRRVFEHRGEHASHWACIESIASKICCTAQTLDNWDKQHERVGGMHDGMTTAEAGCVVDQ